MANLNKRLDKIIPKIKEDKFIQGRGLGNEISFYPKFRKPIMTAIK
jgi:hypothetical protein